MKTPPGPAPVKWVERKTAHGVTSYVVRDFAFLRTATQMAQRDERSGAVAP